MRLIVAGGGTGGHLFPGLAIAEELQRRDGGHEVLFVGARGGLEEQAVPRHGFRLELMPSLKGGLFKWDLPRQTLRLCKGYLQARKAILDFHADAVVGMGGYASVLPVLASWGVEVPCMMLEQNAIPGRTTRRLAGFANEIGTMFAEANEFLPRRARVRQVGNPLRKKLVESSYRAARFNTTTQEVPAQPTLLVLGGSQGARFLNEITVQVWSRLIRIVPDLRIVLVAGIQDYERAIGAFGSAGIRGKVLPFSDEMETLYSEASVVLARAGATSIAEITAFGLPSILVPYPYAADDHQTANARVLQQAGAAWSLEQRSLEPDRLAQRIADLLLQPQRRRRMAQAAAALAKPEAASEVVDCLERLAGLRSFKSPPPPPPTPPPCRPDAVHATVA